MKCKYMEKCIFYNDKMKDKPSAVAVFKKMYCLTDSTQCARYMVAEALGRENVPTDLYPNNKARALLCIAEGKK